ncbi:conserved protein of unknown function [uncultured Woeseiaceae bacterium]|uniref:Uncharacterized protein n=1 Tax=uncultured Woeseiaceae bacterium TaxID=1983305 RepID=A0A7D9H3S1_9GAMM|nr:conserved protein of unknown function [uncultured Woeseiaceae bacterium]
MPFKEEQHVTFPQDSEQNVMLLFGDNMRGKTCFLNAIRWALYGRALGRHLKPIERKNIVNTDLASADDWNTEVSLKFAAGNHEYEVRRTMELGELVSQPRSNKDFKITLAMKKDGSVIRRDLIEHEISQLLPEQVSRFFLFDAELLQEYEMLVTDLDDQGDKIKAAIEQVLGVPALVHGRNDLFVLLKRAKAAHAKASKHVEGLKAQAEEQIRLQAEIEQKENDLKRLKNRASDTQSNIDDLEGYLNERIQIQQHKDQHDALKVTITELKTGREKLKEDRQLEIRSVWVELVRPRLLDYIDKLCEDEEQSRKKMTARITTQFSIESLRKIIDERECSTCGQKIDDMHREKVGAKLGLLEAEFETIDVDEKKLLSIVEERETLSKLIQTDFGRTLQRIEQELSRNEIESTAKENQLSDLAKKIGSYDTAEMSRRREKRDRLQKNLGQLEGQIKDADVKIAELQRKEKALSKILTTSPEARKQRSAIKVDMLENLHEIFSFGIDALRDRLRREVEVGATIAFSHLTSDKSYSGLKINDSYGLTIVDSQDRSVVERSAGAEQIVALSLIDGLNGVAATDAPIVMDTPFGRLDPKHRHNVLKYLPTMARQVILLVHEGEIRKDVDLEPLQHRVGAVYELEYVSSSESRIIRSQS